MKIIIAGNYREYGQYLRTFDHTPRTAMYCVSVKDLLGHKAVEIVWYGTYYARTDAHKIEEQVNAMITEGCVISEVKSPHEI